jgi:flagellar hook-associated protein 2
MAVGTLSSPGIGSNIDISGIVEKLMRLERIPRDRLEDKKSDYEAKISSLGSLKSSLSTLKSSLTSLNSGLAFDVFKADSSDSSIMTATAGSGSIPGNYSIEVSQLAQSQKLVASGQADTTTAIGSGTLTIDFGTISGGTFDSGTGTYTGATFTSNGGGTNDIVIDTSNNTLEGIRDAINEADIGVQASIINDGDPSNPYRLVLSSENSGASESIQISVSGDAALSNLLAHDPAGTQNLSETVTAQDANFTVDGIAITKSSNTVTDVIPGVTLNLAAETTGTPTTLSVGQDTDSVKSSIQAFVDAYNSFYEKIKTETDSGINSGKEGALASDSATRNMHSTLRDLLSQPVSGVTGSYDNLSSIGVSFQADGSLEVDSSRLDDALAADSASVAELFSSADGYGTRLYDAVTSMVGADGILQSRTEGYEDRVDSIEEQVDRMEARLDITETRLRSQFGSLDVLLGNMTTTSNLLSQQLAGLQF